LEWLMLLGAAAFWIGAALMAASLATGLKWRTEPNAAERASARRDTLLLLGLGGLAMVVGASLPKNQLETAVGDIHLPLAVPNMPLLAWFAAIFAVVGLSRLFGLVGAISAMEKQSRARGAAVWLGLAGLTLWQATRSDRPFEVISGTLPLTWGALLGLAALLAVGFGVSLVLAKSAAQREAAGGVAAHGALILGSLIFAIPFAWLVLTSLKEERDMSNTDGMVWLPRIERQHPFDDPERPFVETEYEGRTVRATVTGLARGEDMLSLQVERPFILSGRAFEAPKSETKPIQRMVPVVEGELDGTKVVGFVARELEGGDRQVEILEPESMKGRRHDFGPEEVEPVMDSGARWQNYTEIFEWLPDSARGGFTFLWNTLLIVVLSVVGTLLSCSVVAYGFSRLRFPGRDVLFNIMLATMMLPAAVTLLPTFLIFRDLGMIDTLQPIWLPTFFASAFNVFLLRQFFRTIPMELEDAAKIDGCSYLRAFWQVMLPQIKPALAAIAIWTFMGAWNNFMGPLIYISSPENVPIAYALQLFQTDRGGSFGLMMAASAMATVPVVLLFFFAQRYFIEGVQLSGLGGR
jgi:multiple sugar transport system permease protein